MTTDQPSQDEVEKGLTAFEHALQRAIKYEERDHPIYPKLERLWNESYAARRALIATIDRLRSAPEGDGGVAAGAAPLTAGPTAPPAAHARGPWRACNDGECSCGQVWSTVDDYPVAIVTRGPWGDTWPALRTTDASDGMSGTGLKIEAFIQRMDYGEIHSFVASANARLIAAAPDLLEAAKAALVQAEGCFFNHYPGDDPASASEPEHIAMLRAAIAKAAPPSSGLATPVVRSPKGEPASNPINEE